MLRSRFAPLLGAGLLAAGLLVGVQVQDAVSGSEDVEQLRKIEEAYEYISRAYVEQVDSAQLAEDAIEGMLAGLDPHSIYISAEEIDRVRESFDANFEGVGVSTSSSRAGRTRTRWSCSCPSRAGRATRPASSPATGSYKSTARRPSASTPTACRAASRGPRGTTVDLMVKRPGYRETLDYTITRDQIPLETVIASYMVDDETGLIKLQRFARTSHDEVRAAIEKLQAQGMQRLVLDLRGNAGGLLDQAYAIADEFRPRAR